MSMTLQYDFLGRPALTGHLGPDLSITRATKATMVDADGYIREVQAAEARMTGATFRENLAKETEDLSAWLNNTNVTVADDIDSYSGISLSRITDDATSGQHIARYANVFTSVGKVILSCYVKAGTARYVGMGWRTVDVCVFDTTTGAWTDVDGAYDGSGVTDLGNGYYRIWLYGSSTSANDEQIVGVSSGPTQAEALYVGSGDTILAGGFMVERQTTGVTTPSDYLANDSTTAVTSLTGTSTKGLLVEAAATNICKQSEDFSTTWSVAGGNGSISINTTASPEGATHADTLVDDSGGGASSLVTVYQDVTVSTAIKYTYSVFAKANGNSWMSLALINFTTPANTTDNYFDLGNCVVGTTIGAGLDDYGIEDFGNGWCRCWITFTTDAADTLGRVAVYVADADNDKTVARDGTSSIFLWGAQLEAGAFPTSYIATTTASVTRNADDVETTDVSWASNTAGTFYFAARKEAETFVSNPHLFQLDNGTSLNRYFAYTDTGTDLNFTIVSAAGNNAAITPTDNVATPFKAAIGYAQDDVALYLDGVQTGTDTTYDVIAVSLAGMSVGHRRSSSDEFWNGHIAEMRYWDERFPNDILDLISQGIFPASGHSGIGLGFGKMGAQGAQ